MRRASAFTIFMFWTLVAQAQEFECDGAAYLITYTQSVGISTLHKVEIADGNFRTEEIKLSEPRRLTSLSYHVLDKYLYALDVDSYELIRISSDGTLQNLGVPENIDKSYKFHSGTIAADGSVLTMVGYSDEFGFDNRFYSINMGRRDLYAGYLGVTGDQRVEVHDMATDPIGGTMYGYDNKNGRLVEVGIGGQINSVNFPTTGVKNMDGIFFDADGVLYGFDASRGFYRIDKLQGTLEFIESGPDGTHGDACSCPYESTFEKSIEPRQILPCEEFEVTYTFTNELGIPQTWVKLRDTFPPGFEIMEVESSIVSDVNKVRSEENILALDNLIYLMRENEIKVKVKASSDFLGEFSSRAQHWDFPLAFGEYQTTDDPNTDLLGDESIAEIIGSDDLDFSEFVSFSCDGMTATISSPIDADDYQWSTGEITKDISISAEGTYKLTAIGDCVIYDNSVDIEFFEEEKKVSLIGSSEVILGDDLQFSFDLNRGIPSSITWYYNNESIACQDCFKLEYVPEVNGTLSIEVIDEEGCVTRDSKDIEVVVRRNFFGATAFSPNGDGINDSFFLQSSVPGRVLNMQIFNRWGGVVYDVKDIPLNEGEYGWKGKVDQVNSEVGVYIWTATIEYFDGVIERHSGSFSLISQ